jgi:putative spermidine/putrescine transport system permease protein
MTLHPRLVGRMLMVGLVSPAVALVVGFFLVPLALLFVYSFLGYSQGQVRYAPTAGQYLTLLGDPFYLRIIGRTLAVSLVTTALSIVLGYPVAVGIVRADRRWRPVLLTLVLTPLLIGGVVRGYGWILILDEHGMINSLLSSLGLIHQPLKMLFNFGGVVVTMVEVLMPFFILPLMGTLSNIDPALQRASLSMGASHMQTFLRVTLPLSLAGVIAGGSIVFSLALNLFIVPRIIGGPSYLVLATLAYQQVGEVGNLPFGSAVAMLMLALTAVIVVGINRALLTRFSHVGIA